MERDFVHTFPIDVELIGIQGRNSRWWKGWGGREKEGGREREEGRGVLGETKN